MELTVRWTPVSEDLPKKDGRYLVTNRLRKVDAYGNEFGEPSYIIRTAVFTTRDKRWRTEWGGDLTRITAWMDMIPAYVGAIRSDVE